jgi:hypothetical protein
MNVPTPAGLEYLDLSASKIEGFEGRVEWLYLDTYRHVTTGVGKMLASVLAAQALPFRSPSGEPATMEEIAADFARVSAMEPGHLPTYYLSSTSVRLLNQDVDAILFSVVAECDRWLRKQFANYASWPLAVKLATLDMRYNLGPKRFLHYTKLNAALAAEDWMTAAKQSRRNVSDAAFAERNYWTLSQFLDAEKQAQGHAAA